MEEWAGSVIGGEVVALVGNEVPIRKPKRRRSCIWNKVDSIKWIRDENCTHRRADDRKACGWE
jgi:hypothetical protein